MAEPYIDQYETVGYGNFTVAQILGMLVGLDPEYDDTLKIVAGRVDKGTKGMEAAFGKVGALDMVTYQAAEGEPDVVDNGRKVMRKLIKYAESRDKGEDIASQMLQGSNLTTLGRKRPAKLLAVMNHALGVIETRKAELTEHADWTSRLGRRATRSTRSTRTCARREWPAGT